MIEKSGTGDRIQPAWVIGILEMRNHARTPEMPVVHSARTVLVPNVTGSCRNTQCIPRCGIEVCAVAKDGKAPCPNVSEEIGARTGRKIKIPFEAVPPGD